MAGEKLRTELGLQTPSKKLLVIMGVNGDSHFSVMCWIPLVGKAITFDTYKGVDHAGLRIRWRRKCK